MPPAYRTAAVAPNGTGARGTTGAGARARTSRPVGASSMRLPVRILLWVLAFVFGALVVRFLAKVTGFAGGDTFFDLLVDGSVGTYIRLLALVPVWALFTTLLATAFIDGPRAWARRRAGLATAEPEGARAARAGCRPRRVREREQPVVPSSPGRSRRACRAPPGRSRAGSRPRWRRPARRLRRHRRACPTRRRSRRRSHGPRRCPPQPERRRRTTRPPTTPHAAAAGQRPRRIPRRGAAS